MRPVLDPFRARLWRDPGSLQLGRSPDRAVVLSGLDTADRSVLGLLDGTRDVAAVVAAASDVGCSPRRAQELLGMLQEAGLVVDAAEAWPARLRVQERDRLADDVASLSVLHGGAGVPALRRRDQTAVAVIGGGRVGAPLAALLAASGVGTVDVVDDGTVQARDTAVGGLAPEDVGRRRGDAARERLRSRSPSTRSGVLRPDVVVLAPPGRLDPLDVGALQRDRVPYLVAEVRDTVGVVGPLVVPGRSSCLHCLDLLRAERDPGWPAVAAQLTAPARSAGACDSTLAAAVAAQGALQVLALLDGSVPACLDGTLELALPDWRWRRRSWTPHPACDCRWQDAG